MTRFACLSLSALLFLPACSDSDDSDVANDSSAAGEGEGAEGRGNEDAGNGGMMASSSSTDGGGASSSSDGGGAANGGGGTGETWTAFGQGFFDSYCVECHGAGSMRDYTLLEEVQQDADLIRCGVAVEKLEGCGDWPPPQQFPIGMGPKPSDEERERLVEWIDAGAPE